SSQSSSSSSPTPPTTDYAPPCDCTCSCCCPSPKELSSKPVRYFNGEVRLMAEDLHSSGYGMEWGHKRTYSNRLSKNYDFGNGYNWLVDQWSYITNASNGWVEVVFNPFLSYWFQLVGGVYVPQFGAKQTLTHVGNRLVLTFPEGEVYTYRDFNDPLVPG